MIVAESKPLDEIKEMMKGFKKILNVGCGGCTSICMAGGQREVGLLNEELQNVLKRDGASFQVDGFTVERQCNGDFYSDLDEIVRGYPWLAEPGSSFLPTDIPRNRSFRH
jgi:hypothetical protein